ncbi:MAG TPA: sugar phosphate isomerase/epimerase family protein [Chthonomonadaceae bacterium]|nr:sugar phosphate isomerase/epimerase family protein [Chthonomonadaceae bacterium]
MKLAAFPKCFMDELCVHRTMSVFDWIALAEKELKPLGVTGLEMYTGFLTSYEPDYLAQVKAALEAAGFAMPMFCASPDFTSPDPAHRRAEVEKERQMMAVSAALGGATCRVLSGQRRPEVSREQGVRWVVECISELLPYAAQRGVILTMENHFKDNYWQYPEFAQRMDIFVEIVNKIDSPWFGVNFDPSNTLLANENPLELLERVKHRVVTMHASDRRPRPGVEIGPEGITDYTQLIHGEVGTGMNDYDAIFRILRSVGFDGWVSIEDGVNGIEELKRSAQFLAAKMGL